MRTRPGLPQDDNGRCNRSVGWTSRNDSREDYFSRESMVIPQERADAMSEDVNVGLSGTVNLRRGVCNRVI